MEIKGMATEIKAMETEKTNNMLTYFKLEPLIEVLFFWNKNSYLNLKQNVNHFTLAQLLGISEKIFQTKSHKKLCDLNLKRLEH